MGASERGLRAFQKTVAAEPQSTFQSLASQDAQLRAAGCAKVYSEKVSGAKTDRAELAKLLKRLGDGDALMVTRLDRLARSTRDLLIILDTIPKAGAGFKSLTDTWADTKTAHGRRITRAILWLHSAKA